MSEDKPRRATRAVVRGQIARDEPAPSDPIATIAPVAEPAAVTLELPAAAEPAPPASAAAPAEPDLWAAFGEAQSALSRGVNEVAAEFAGLTRHGVANASEAAIAMLGATTFAELVEINAGFTRRGVDALIEGSAKLSELGIKTATEASRPFLSHPFLSR